MFAISLHALVEQMRRRPDWMKFGGMAGYIVIYMCIGFLTMAFLQFIPTTNEEDEWVTKEIEFGTNGFIEYHPGNTNLIITIPHGGKLRPKFMKDRTKSAYSLEDTEAQNQVSVTADSKTLILGQRLVAAFVSLTGSQPHVVFSKLHRIKVDMNRPPEIGICPDDAFSEVAYKEYHAFIEKASKSIGGPGLLVDLHGHNHDQNSLELGYLLYKSDLNSQNYRRRSSSLNYLLKKLDVPIEDLLFGPKSLGAFFEVRGYQAIPSPRQKMPGENKYYPGGYTTQTHGSQTSGEIDAIQIEVPSEIRADESMRDKFASDFASVLHSFHSNLYKNS